MRKTVNNTTRVESTGSEERGEAKNIKEVIVQKRDG